MEQPLKIVHVFRDPVGGIFRHVRDLLAEQSAAGHQVGIICDSNTGGDYEARMFEQIRPDLALGLHRIPMTRSITPVDIVATLKTRSIIRTIQPDVIHSHSAKGGVYGRLAARFASGKKTRSKAFYCPHGGAMHYDKRSLKGIIFFAAERFLERYTDSLIFVSGYEQSAYHEKVGMPRCPETVVYNGLDETEFTAVPAKPGAADFLYIGMKRDLKGPDVFLDALAIARDQHGRTFSAWFVGDGPDVDKYHTQIQKLGLTDQVKEQAAMPAREAFALAEIVVVPSRAESMPYLVLEAIAAHKPMVCTRVGGIPEIFDHDVGQLVEPGDPEALARAMIDSHDNRERNREANVFAARLKTRFSRPVMASSMEKTYRR
jgi:glycosyltransferase involved in cell wall biosynthesis